MDIAQSEKIQSVIDRFDAPFFFYNLDKLKAHLEYMSEGLHPDIKLWYACKANPMSAILKVLRNLGFGIDVASSGELHQVLNTGIDPKNVLATGPGKSKDYLRQLVRSGIQTIVLESSNQAKWLNEVADELSTKVDCLIRVQLDWDEGKSVLGGNSITPFGISTSEWKEVDLQSFSNLNIRGYHVFQWGNILELSQLEKIWTKTIEEVLSLSESLNIPCEVLDLGGGLGVHYNFTGDLIDFKLVQSLLVNLKEKYKLDKIWMELGRYTVAECGYYFTKVIDRKKARNKDILVCESGINHMARVALVNQAFPATAFNNDHAKTTNFQVHGPLCTALDHLGDFDLPSNIEIGDWLVFHKSGAYGFTESMPYFLCHMLAGEVILYNNDLMIPRPPKTSYDWMI